MVSYELFIVMYLIYVNLNEIDYYSNKKMVLYLINWLVSQCIV